MSLPPRGRRGRGGQDGHDPRARIRARERRTMDLTVLGWSQQQIAADLGVTQAAVSKILSVSNSLSGRHWELDQVPAVGDLTDIVQLGTGHHVSAGEGQRRVALQRRVAAYLVGGGQTPRNVASILDSVRELGIRDAQDPHLPMRYDTGRPRAVIRLRISQPRTTSLPCPAGLRARRPSPMMDLYRKNTFSTRL